MVKTKIQNMKLFTKLWNFVCEFFFYAGVRVIICQKTFNMHIDSCNVKISWFNAFCYKCWDFDLEIASAFREKSQCLLNVYNHHSISKIRMVDGCWLQWIANRSTSSKLSSVNWIENTSNTTCYNCYIKIQTAVCTRQM